MRTRDTTARRMALAGALALGGTGPAAAATVQFATCNYVITLPGTYVLAAVRAEASRLYRAGRRGELPAADASRLATILALIVRTLDGAELEARIEALEQGRSGQVPNLKVIK